jgi:FAD/FMN-containing dehydrogenase
MSGLETNQAAGLAAALGERVTGRVISQADADYAEAAAVWNGCIESRPALVVQCHSTIDVAATVSFTRQHGLVLAVRGGGHSLPGFSTCDDGIVLDLSPMRSVTLDASRSVASAQGGCTWGQYDAATGVHGLASTGGLISTTGIAGLTLGGGIGWLMRKYGLACDNLLGAEVVTAAGEIVQATDSENPELLWGLRGGGGNFGVVTDFEFRLHPVQTVIAGLILFPHDRAAEIARFYQDYVEELPDEFTTMLVALTAPPEDFVPVEMQGQPAIGIVGCHCGTEASAETMLAPIRALRPAVDLFEPMGYPSFQSMFDADSPTGDRYYFRGGFLPACTDRVAEVVIQHMAGRPSSRSEFDLHHMGGAVARVRAGDTAFVDRASVFTYNILAVWDDTADDDANRAWAKGFAASLDQFAGDRAYVNFLSESLPQAAIRRAYGEERYARLVDLKRKYDPDNVFYLNQNIVP